MAEVPSIVKQKIELFIRLLESNSIKIHRAVLFGSYASGNFNEWSDIDLALVSDDFTGNRFQDKISLIDLILEAGSDLSPVPFTVEDYKNSMFARDEIEKKGIVMKINYGE